MKVTGSLYVKNGIYQMMVRVPDKNGKAKQVSKTTGVKVEGKNQRETKRRGPNRSSSFFSRDISKAYSGGEIL